MYCFLICEQCFWYLIFTQCSLYKSQVLLETLRMHPPVGGITKELATDTVLGDTKVPAGTMVFVSSLRIILYQINDYFDVS